MRLNECFQVETEFTRSVNLAADLSDAGVASRYVWTQSNAKTLARIQHELDQGGRSAISLTGPFGTGKSAFLLQLLHLYGVGGKAAAAAAAKRLEPVATAAHATRKPPFPVIITGTGGPVAEIITAGIATALDQAGVKAVKTKGRITKYLRGDHSIDHVIDGLIEDTQGSYHGVFIIIDEFGKLLEHAALHASEDIYLLQELAELRVGTPAAPYLLLTVLHQSFEGYARYLSKAKQNEWTKIQGRFLNLTVAEEPSELVPLAADAVRQASRLPAKLAGGLKQHCQAASAALVATHTGSVFPLEDLAATCERAYPLNPLALLVLPYLSKVAGQNNRSTFTFLGSADPHSLLEFLAQHEMAGSVCPEASLAELYDYFATSGYQGVGQAAARWQLVRVALENLDHSEEDLLRVLKVIGVLNILQLPRLFRADRQTIAAALQLDDQTLDQALTTLESRSAIVYRRFAKEYRLWEGSDFNIEEEIATRAEAPLQAKELLRQLQRLLPQSSLIARRHYDETGTLRYFHSQYVSLEELRRPGAAKLLAEAATDVGAEGLVLLTLTHNTEEFEQAVELIETTHHKLPAVVTILAEPRYELLDLLRELVVLEDILRHNSALSSDAVARREVRSRISDLEDRLIQQISETFWSFRSGRVYSGADVMTSVTSKRQFNSLLSEVFDGIFDEAPVVRNELVNRHAIPGSITLAVKGVIERLIDERQGQEDLGFAKEDYSSSASIYRLLLRQAGLHREDDGQWACGRPPAHHGQWRKVWDDVVAWIGAQEGTDIPVTALYDHFAAAPYGIRAPVMALVLISYLESRSNEITVYESGTYCPVRDFTMYELLLRRPHLFALRKVAGASHHPAFLAALEQEFGIDVATDASEADRLKEVVLHLMRALRRLPQVTMTTRRIRPATLAMRDILDRSRRPEDLVYTDLPAALDEPLKDPGEKSAGQHAKKVAKEITSHLAQLAKHLEAIREDAFKILTDVFGLSRRGAKPITAVMNRLSERAMGIKDVAKSMLVRNFIVHATKLNLEPDAWLEGVLGNIAGKNIRTWHDADIEDFANKCRVLYGSFAEYEKLLSNLGDRNAIAGTRFTLTTSTGEQVDHWLDHDLTPSREVQRTVSKVRTALNGLEGPDRTAALLVALKELAT